MIVDELYARPLARDSHVSVGGADGVVEVVVSACRDDGAEPYQCTGEDSFTDSNEVIPLRLCDLCTWASVDTNM